MRTTRSTDRSPANPGCARGYLSLASRTFSAQWTRVSLQCASACAQSPSRHSVPFVFTALTRTPAGMISGPSKARLLLPNNAADSSPMRPRVPSAPVWLCSSVSITQSHVLAKYGAARLVDSIDPLPLAESALSTQVANWPSRVFPTATILDGFSALAGRGRPQRVLPCSPWAHGFSLRSLQYRHRTASLFPSTGSFATLTSPGGFRTADER